MNKITIALIGFVALSVIVTLIFPRGIRNNNPGNVKRTAAKWQGMVPIQTDNTFVQFVHPKYGFRAMTRILRNYQRRGLNTVTKIISTYAPSTENDTQSYIHFVAKRLNVKPDTPLNLEQHLPALLKAIAIHENGFKFVNFYSDATIAEGIKLA